MIKKGNNIYISKHQEQKEYVLLFNIQSLEYKIKSLYQKDLKDVDLKELKQLKDL